jgi:2-dehydropantoate 2-reductase
MKITVYGAGSIGGYLAATLADFGHEVTAIARGDHLQAIRDRGLTLIGPAGHETTVRCAASDRAGKLGVQDIVIVAVKQPGLAAIAHDLRGLIGPATAVVFALNGIPWWYDSGLDVLDPGGALHAAVPRNARVGCVVNFAAEIVCPGTIRCQSVTRNGSGSFFLGVPHGERFEPARIVSQAMQEAGLHAPVDHDLRARIWGKLMMNVAIAAPAALTGLVVADVIRNPELFALSIKLAQEIHDLASVQDIVPGTAVDALRDPKFKDWRHRPSLLQDIEKGRPTEFAGLFLAPQAIARRNNFVSPYLDTICAILGARICGR